MRIFDRYVLRRFLSSFFFVVLIIVAVIVVIDITEKTEKFAKNNLGPSDIMGYYINFVPWIANLITPITTFIATVFVNSKMAGHTEIVAILSSGVSFRRFLVPYLIGASIIAMGSFLLAGWVIPNSNKSRVAFEIQYIKKQYYFKERNIHIQVAKDTYLYMKSYNNQSNSGNSFTLEKMEGTKMMEKLKADKIVWDADSQRWNLRNWEIRTINERTEEVSKGKEMDTVLAIHPDEFGNDYREYDAMTIHELNDEIVKLRARGASNVEVYEVEKYTRFSLPFAILILTFMGVIVSSRKVRGGAGFQIALGFLLSFIFIIFFTMSKTVAEAGSMPAEIAIWIPNIIFGIISLIMYKTVPR